VSDGRVVLKENRIMMVSDEMGDVPAGNSRGLGLYFSDTRFLSAYEFRLNHLQPILLSASVDESYVATFQMVNPVLLLDEGKRRIPQQSISIRRSRFIYGGLHERIGLQNCGGEPVEIECSLRLSADFRDMFDVRGYKKQGGGSLRPTNFENQEVSFTYEGQDGLLRRTEVVVNRPITSHHDDTICWQIHLASKERITLVIDIIPLIG
jgi:glycogen debranching enzyme